MSSRPLDPEEAAVLAVFAELGRMPGGESTRVTSAEDDVEEVLRRLDLEAFGLVGWGLDLVPPPAAIRERLLEHAPRDWTGPRGGPRPDNLFIHPRALGGVMLGVSRTTHAWTWSGHPDRVR